jgi:hypothetical protein
MPPWLKRIVSEPLHHFLLLGVGIFALYSWLGSDDGAVGEKRIVVSAADVSQLGELWAKRWGRPPTPEELRGLVDGRVREEVLYREALSLGLDRDDTIVRRRLAQKMEFLFQDLGDLEEPDDAVLEAYLAEHPERFREPARLSLSHVYVSRDRRGDAAEADAQRILTELRAAAPGGDPTGYGDPFPRASRYDDLDVDRIARLYGTPFAERAATLAPGAWQGPVESGYGLHLVFVHERSEPRLPALAEVEKQVRMEWRAARRREVNEAVFTRLLEGYEVVVETPEPPQSAAGPVDEQATP